MISNDALATKLACITVIREILFETVKDPMARAAILERARVQVETATFADENNVVDVERTKQVRMGAETILGFFDGPD